MGSLFKRKDSRFWWVGFTDATGRRQNVSSGTEDEAVARKLLEKVERRVKAELEAGGGERPLTLERYAKEVWLPARRRRGLVSVDKDEDCLAHVLRELGQLKLEDVRPLHVRRLVRGLWDSGELANRTVRAVYATLRVLYSDAVAEELVGTTPCVLRERRGELPPRTDKDPRWRLGAVYARDEVERLISDERIPEWRRVLWALLFLTGSRVNEVTPRRWRDYDPSARPLGRLVLDTHWDMKAKLERPATKTGVVREAPVHPTLAALLAAWRLSGWEAFQGRRPGPEDLLVPSPYQRRPGDPAGPFLNSNASLRRLKADCDLLGIRARDQHSMRRTFISLGVADGALEAILRRVTHEGRTSIIDLYKVLPWEALCGEVAKLRVVARKGQVVRLERASTAMLREEQMAEMTAEKDGRGGTRSRYRPPRVVSVPNRLRVVPGTSGGGAGDSALPVAGDRSGGATGEGGAR